MAVKSKQSGKVYFTAKTVFVSGTFDEQTTLSLVGAEFEGTVKKVNTEPYEYTIEETGELIEMNHRWEYVKLALEREVQIVAEKSIY
ncbi:hypothetical protein K8354_11320 [Polaribacter litorisediminis]|uniref:hypothetical protein n=1 Tax=Polaribacter litorisediminis TaxID=1908341 RepID=UPI001CBF9669|nr:hypothetical protein [Polaribacter litorisediminis]UAM96913.1 hypothetical protein K8354_11320 [Polaribacter litorisediminis]